MPDPRRHPPIALTRSCPRPPGIEALGAHCLLAGHWWTRAHALETRVLPEAVLILCLAGRGWARVGRRRAAVGPGDLLVCPAGIAHSYGCDPEAGWEIHWVHFQGAHGEALCRTAGWTGARPVAPAPEPRALAARFAAVLETLGRTGAGMPWDAAGALHALLGELVRQCVAPAGGGLLALADASVESLDELAARAGCSKHHFCRRFKAETGRSPWQVVLERKTERAKELLLGTRLSVKEIAALLGFPHADYFARLFRRHTGVLPSAYRG
ncbi:MAG: AraC family transcriptional regulator [Planctomycetota bacterium]